jgi:hypothetical protein
MVAGEPGCCSTYAANRDRFNILQAAEAGALAPIQELADSMVISDPRVLVADGNGKKFEVSLGRFGADIGDERWNLEGSGFDEGLRHCRFQLKRRLAIGDFSSESTI